MLTQVLEQDLILVTALAFVSLPHPSARAVNIYQFGDSFGTRMPTAGNSTSGGGSAPDAIGGHLDRRFTVPVGIDFTVYSDAGSAVSTATLAVPGMLPEGGSLFLPFGQFVGDANFSDVSGLQFSFVSGFGQDLLIDYIAVATIVPEPASAALLALGGVVLVIRRRSVRGQPWQA